MRKLKGFIKNLWTIFSMIFIAYVLILFLQGKNPKEEILSWFDNTVTLESVMEENSMTREEAFAYLMDTTSPDDLPGILEDMKDHVFLDARGAGISSKLKGDVRAIVIFTDTASSSWTSEEMEAVQTELENLTSDIMAEAISHGAELSLSLEYHTGKSYASEVPESNTTNWADQVLSSAGLPSSETASHDLELEYKVDEAPILFCINHFDRSHALSWQYSGHSEYAFLFRDTDGFGSYPHELYHLFGAKDFYYPADVKALAESYFPESTMLISEGCVADDLTAYLIGWTDTPSESVLDFLQATAYLTPEYMSQQHDLETFTGYVEDYTDGESTYTGYLDFGVPQGQGTKEWNDGNRYEGNWNYGTFHGEGTYIWADGTTYTGSWEQGKRQGFGTMTWLDGTSYTGDWANDTFHGQGTMFYVDSGTYTGSFVEGQRSGEGTYTWINGNTYTGSWNMGQQYGSGTFTWTNGDTFTGEWVDGQRTGYGTYTWADGSQRSGYWENNQFIE